MVNRKLSRLHPEIRKGGGVVNPPFAVPVAPSYSDPNQQITWHHGKKIHEPKAEMLMHLAASGTGTVPFVVPIPDSRLRVKVAVFFVPIEPSAAPSIPCDITGAGATLWMQAREYDRSGRAGLEIPVADLIVVGGVTYTIASPLTIPRNSGVMGYAEEFVTSADCIYGALTASFPASSLRGRWMLQCRYQPDGFDPSWEEWDAIVRECNPARRGPAVVFGSVS